jgi:tRNA modification GTPase
VEKIGIRRTQEAAARADIIVLITDITEVEPDGALIKDLPHGIPVLQVVNKIDLAARAPEIIQGKPYTKVFLSAKNAQGLELLRQAILDMAGWQPSGEGTFVARQRHLEALKQAGDFLDRANLVKDRPELFAEELRQAQQALNMITGEFSADDLLGEIFSRFCVGK